MATIPLLLLLVLPLTAASDVPIRGVYETTGFHCINRDSMRLPRHLHGFPQTTEPPFEFNILDSKGVKVDTYEPRMNYTVKLEGYIHIRGLMIQPRLSTPDGHLIGTLRGGKFFRNGLEEYGIGIQECSRSPIDDALTHINDEKKFLVEAIWTTDVDVGNVQFVATIASENDLYWERYRPKSAFLKSTDNKNLDTEDELFRYSSFMKEKLMEEMDLNITETIFKLTKSQEERSQIEDRIFAVNEVDGSGEMIKIDASDIVTERSSTTSGELLEPIGSSTEANFISLNKAPETEMLMQQMIEKFTPQRDFVENMIDEEMCMENPCLNGGKCFDHGGNMTCSCPNDYVGNRCEVACRPNQCLNGGKCILSRQNTAACECIPGFTGSMCEREINECLRAKCKNGATCIDQVNDYKCVCGEGWMGKDCDRPCRDVFKSCDLWRREGQCDLLQDHTSYFKVNCAASCGVCQKVNGTDVDHTPITPILLPFSWLIGEWSTHVKGWNDRTTDYPIDMSGMGYNETLTFSVAPPLMFGTPSINYTAVMISDEDPSNVHIHNGFLTIQQYKSVDQEKDRASLTTVTNNGVTMIEEGEMEDDKISLVPMFIKHVDVVTDAIPEKMKRWFAKKGMRLVQNIVREHKGRLHKFTKIYKKTKDIPYL